MTEAQVKNLAKAVGRWLAFQVLCGRDVLLSESYLSQPLAEFLLHHHSGTLATERRHPGLQRGGRGRPRQVDFVLLSRDAEAAEAVIEAKWVTDRPYPKQAVVDDLLRLECFREGGRHVRRYFLVAGKNVTFEPDSSGCSSTHAVAAKASQGSSFHSRKRNRGGPST